MSNKTHKLNNLYIAHRGIYNNENIVENTMEAFEQALKKKMPIELDVRILKDNTLIVFHDNTLKRLGNSPLKIEKLTQHDLPFITLLKTSSKIPMFTDVLKKIDGKVLLDVEIKDSKKPIKLLKECIKLMDNYQGEFLIKSFNPIYIFLIRLLRQNYQRGLLVNKKTIKTPLSFTLAKPDFICCNSNIINNQKIQKYIKKHDCALLCYNIKDKNEAQKYKANGYIIDQNIQRKLPK